jgi:uncharacterized protein YjbI with pentapeptide repeats
LELAKLSGNDRVTAELSYANAKNAVRTTLIQAAGGAAFLATAFFAWRQLVVSRLGQLTERFSRSIDQIGEESVVVRLGAVYTLEQMSRDDRFEEPVARVLAAYVRQSPNSEQDGGRSVARQASSRSISRQAPTEIAAALDLQQAATIVVTGGLWKRATGVPLDLTDARLAGLDLSRADLSYSILYRVNFRFANLQNSTLEWADLREAQLSQAILAGARLSEAKMNGAKLAHADLRGASSRHGLKCADADLNNAIFIKAELNFTDFSRCDMRDLRADGAALVGAVFVDADLRDAKFMDANLIGANFTNANLAGGNFTGADLSNVTFTGADLSNVVWGGANLREVIGGPDPK